MFQGKRAVMAIAVVTVSILAGCGGGGGGSSESGPVLPAKTLSWAPPTAYTDGTPLTPTADLESFEIYVKESGSFSDSDTPMAMVGAVNPQNGQLVTTFNLANLGPYINLGVQYQVTLRAVAITGAKSGFSAPAIFSF